MLMNVNETVEKLVSQRSGHHQSAVNTEYYKQYFISACDISSLCKLTLQWEAYPTFTKRCQTFELPHHSVIYMYTILFQVNRTWNQRQLGRVECV